MISRLLVLILARRNGRSDCFLSLIYGTICLVQSVLMRRRAQGALLKLTTEHECIYASVTAHVSDHRQSPSTLMPHTHLMASKAQPPASRIPKVPTTKPRQGKPPNRLTFPPFRPITIRYRAPAAAVAHHIHNYPRTLQANKQPYNPHPPLGSSAKAIPPPFFSPRHTTDP